MKRENVGRATPVEGDQEQVSIVSQPRAGHAHATKKEPLFYFTHGGWHRRGHLFARLRTALRGICMLPDPVRTSQKGWKTRLRRKSLVCAASSPRLLSFHSTTQRNATSPCTTGLSPGRAGRRQQGVQAMRSSAPRSRRGFFFDANESQKGFGRVHEPRRAQSNLRPHVHMLPKCRDVAALGKGRVLSAGRGRTVVLQVRRVSENRRHY